MEDAPARASTSAGGAVPSWAIEREAESSCRCRCDSGCLSPRASGEEPYGVTKQRLELGVFAHVGSALTERQARFALAETERAQGTESSELDVPSVW